MFPNDANAWIAAGYYNAAKWQMTCINISW